MTLRRLESHREILEATGGSAFVRYDVPVRLAGPGFELAGAVVVPRRTHTGRLGLLCLGTSEGLAELIPRALGAGLAHVPLRGFTTRKGTFEAVGRSFPDGSVSDWEWMYAVQPPPRAPAESRLVTLAAGDLPQIAQLLSGANPRTDARPSATGGQRWVGARDGAGQLVACGVEEPNQAGYPILSGITVHPSHRGMGLGLAVTAHLTREGVRTSGVCTISLYSDNDVARRVYGGLGYDDIHAWSSCHFDVAP
jgi:ribosomal protein S18 acetylase RimI-like enzyme